ncbi:MAG: hypothetical protein U9R79_10755 [Armatimonadota bacterium]|nr:hypothetical protein [Armatimonadota bacterium]
MQGTGLAWRVGLLVTFVAVAPHAPAAENLARGQPYTLVPAPSYSLCTDEGDLQQLTDGRLAADDQQMWVQEGCVGWKLPVDGEAEVIVDLSQVQAISAIRFRSASGPNADVYLPSATFAVGRDRSTFRVVGRVNTRHDRQLARRWIGVEDLRAAGRFVMVRLRANGVFAFLDEVQVLAGEHDVAAVQPDREAEVLQPLQEAVERTPLQRRLLRDLAMIRGRVQGSGMLAEQELLRRLDELEGRIEAVDETTGEEADAAEAAVAEVHADLLGMVRGDASVVAWRAEPYAPLSPRELQPLEHESEIEIVLARNAHASAAVNIQNLTDGEVEVPVRLEGLEELVTLREARFIPTRQGNLLADALPLVDDGAITLPPHETGQVWLSVASAETPPGRYEGALSIDAASPRAVPVAVTVTEARIPDDVPIATYSWQYLDTWPALQGIEKEAIADLLAHHTNVTVLTSNSAPWPQEVDEEGNLVGDLDFAEHDRVVELCRPMSRRGIMWFCGFHGGQPGFREFEWMDERWRRLFGQWLRAWVAHLHEIGIGYDDFIFYPLDETIDEKFVEIAGLTREVDPKVRIFADPLARDSDARLRQALPLVDVWCPNLDAYQRRPEQLAMIRDTGATVWSYMVGRRERPPLEYRLHLWRAWRDGATGAGFWTYAQGGDWRDDDLWDDFSGRGSDYGVIYTLNGAPEDVTRAEQIIPGKRWEAWREGIEDWVCLWLLDRELEAGGGDREWLQATVGEVLAAPDDPSRASEARAQVLQRLAGG